ncbi:uncharacterized protein Bfra_004624 [Botrytis fragariae]|uniref:Uncharacterized protein n=1 Tax=Botrytis fragariae TaxID=1964551 RepID=A0A8H6AW01_9HELO|nr:uncharacterized protein Bfra_004624 [Botrytis fragariae]KAF5874612.1 hypothetical protein Bfra_004624 [Botrytis fragariae]
MTCSAILVLSHPGAQDAFLQTPLETPDQLELHKAALLYHKQKHTLPPMQQVQKSPVHSPEESIQQKVGVSLDSQISIGNVFQDGIPSLPVMHLPEHHLVRLRELKIQIVDNISSPTVERQEVEETKRFKTSGDVEENRLAQEEQLPNKTDDIAHKTPMHISNLFRTHFHRTKNCTFSSILSEKSRRAEIEDKTNIRFKEATETNSTHPVPTHDPNWPLPPPESSSTCNMANRASAEQNYNSSENTITVGKDNKNEGHCHNSESMKISETIIEERHEFDIGPSKASRMKLYQAWKRRILELSGAKEVN